MGFVITNVVEPKPAKDKLEELPDNPVELRRPMMLLISSNKK